MHVEPKVASIYTSIHTYINICDVCFDKLRHEQDADINFSIEDGEPQSNFFIGLIPPNMYIAYESNHGILIILYVETATNLINRVCYRIIPQKNK